MATLNKGLITQKGLDLFEKVEAGNAQITYTKVVFSSNSDILKMQDSDVRELNDVQPQELKGTPQAYDNGTVTGENNIKAAEIDIRCIADNENLTTGFKPYTTALYASDGKNEILYGLYLRDDPGYMPSYDGFTRQPLMFTWRLFTATTDNFNLDDKSDVYATLADLKGIEDKVNAIQQSTDDLTKQINDKISDLSSNLHDSINQALSTMKQQNSDFLNKYSDRINALEATTTKLKGNPPTQPTLQASMDTDKGRITYAIQPPSNNGGSNIYQYQIFYKSVNDLDYNETDQAGNILNGTIYNLDGKVKYNLYVIAQNAAGASPQSALVTTDVVDTSILGVSWDRTASGTNLQRTDGAKGAYCGINGDRNDFDSKPIYKDIHKTEDNNGNVMVSIPAFYEYKSQTGAKDSGNVTVKISLRPHGNDWFLPSPFWDFQNNKKRDHILVGAYDANDNGNGGLGSVSGSTPLVSTDINDFRSKARATGNGYQLLDIHVWNVLQTLFVIEFATLDGQSVMNGYVNASSMVNNGTADGLAGSSHTAGNGVMSYRGIENMWGNLWQWCDGINFSNNSIYVCDNPANYQSDVFTAPYLQLDYQFTATSDPSQLGYDPAHPDVRLGTDSAGSDGTYYHDYQYTGGSGNYVLYVGGDWDHGTDAGPFFAGGNYSSSNTDDAIGSRLVIEP